MGNIVGLDLNIDQNYLEQAVQQTVMMGIAEALNGKNEIVSQIVKMVLQTKVDSDGKIPRYSSDRTMPLLEFYVKQLITEETKNEMKRMVEEHRPEITKAIRDELSKKVNYTKFVDQFISNVSDAVSNTWYPKIEVSFEAKKTEY